jgi:Holliday junction DNA helicase RuvB
MTDQSEQRGDDQAMSARAASERSERAGDTAPGDSPGPRERSELAGAPEARLGSQDGPERSEWARPDPISSDESAVEQSLRPKRFTEFVGQPKVREQLQLVLESALRRNRPPDHVLLSGPPGLGKTSLAMIIAAELGTPIRVTSGPAIERAGDLAALLTSLAEGEVLFIDEIHRIARPAEELLYMAMEDFRVDVVVGKGPGATAIPLDLAPFTLVGATTRAGLLTGPLRDRFGFTGHMDFYSSDELEQVLRRSAVLLEVDLRDDGATEIAGRSRGTPRIANRLLRRVRDYAEVRADGVVTEDIARAALAVYDVDDLGLDRLDRAVLDALVRRFGGGPVGVGTLAVAVGEEVETVEEVAEPFLVRAGLLARTPRGRLATPAAWQHLGLAAPAAAAGGPTLFDA